jgi:hypothetical protein
MMAVVLEWNLPNPQEVLGGLFDYINAQVQHGRVRAHMHPAMYAKNAAH